MKETTWKELQEYENHCLWMIQMTTTTGPQGVCVFVVIGNFDILMLQ